MFSFLKNHPFPVEAFFESSLVLTFAVPRDYLQNLIPECLELDVFDDQWAFIAAAMVETRNLRPKKLPKIFGRDFFLIGYRVFVRYRSAAGKSLRGLYILKSETDRRTMEIFGNFFTHYSYTTTDIKKISRGETIEIKSLKSDFKIIIDKSSVSDVSLPADSPFADWQQARKYAGPLPFTFTYFPETEEVLIIEGVRENWKPRPVKVIEFHFSFLNALNLSGAKLANAFLIENVPYHWKKGRIEKWRR